MSHRHQVTALSKLMSYILRHRPDEYGLVLDENGYVPIKELLQAINEEEGWSYVRRADIMEVVMTSERGRFEVDGERIRATYGHSFASPIISYEAVTPPSILYHGTRRRSYPHILQGGLAPMGRQYVHLTTTAKLALRIGRRRDPQPVLLEIAARRAAQDGIAFYQANPLIYLADHIPPAYISGPPLDTLKAEWCPPKEASKRQAPQQQTGDIPTPGIHGLRMDSLYRYKKKQRDKERKGHRRHGVKRII